MSARLAHAASRGSAGIARWFVLGVMAVGCLVLWIGVPLGALWVGSKLTDSAGLHMPISLVLAIAGMFVIATGLAWVNGLYLRMTGGEARNIRGLVLRRTGPLEPMLATCLVLAIVAFLVWFFVLAENPTVNVY
jgi:hypothetical protein